jgi:hypothetical protein
MSHSAAHGCTLKSVVTALRAALPDRLLLSAAILALLRAGGACAGDTAVVAPAETPHGPALRQTFSPTALPEFSKHYTLTDPLLTAPREYRLGEMLQTKAYSATDFRPRGHSIFDADPRLSAPVDVLGSNKSRDLMEQLRQYKSRDHIRVLTLWDTGASAISIQTDRKGDPSLQWTSHLFNRGGATNGLLDQLFPVSVFGGATHITRSASSQPSRVSGALSVLHFGSVPPP